MLETTLRDVCETDAEAIVAIYNHYIVNTVVTFEEQAVTPNEMLSRIESVISASLPWIVVEQDGQVAGYAYASKWHGRCAYRYTAESTVYLDRHSIGRGLGTRLYEALLMKLQRKAMHVVIGGVALPNAASVALHEKLGFMKAAHYHEVGYKFGRWIDVGYWERTLTKQH